MLTYLLIRDPAQLSQLLLSGINACKPASDFDDNPVSNPDCQPISNPVSNCACSPVSNPDCELTGTPDTRPSSNPVSNPDCRPNNNPGYTSKTSSKLDCRNHKAGYKPGSKANRRVIPEANRSVISDIGSEDKEKTSVEMKQGKKHLQATFRYNSINHLTCGERASLKLPKVVFVSPKEVQLVECGSEVSDPHPVNMCPAESIVKDAMDMLTVNNCRVNDGDISETVRVGKLGTFTLASMKIFQNMCTLQSDAVKLQQGRNWLSEEKENLPVIKKIQDILQNSRPHDKILRQGILIIDVHDFSTLACK